MLLLFSSFLLTLQLQQKALEVDSSRVSEAIQNLINSWKASDNQAAEDGPATTSNGSQAEASARGDSSDEAQPSGRGNSPSTLDRPSEDDQQQAQRSKLLSLFSRGKNGQQQPEELIPMRVRNARKSSINSQP